MEPLNKTEIGALLEALDDEYQAFATYSQVISDFGPVRPFVNIREAEGRHIAALQRLFNRHGVPTPDNKWLGKAPRYRNIEEACRAGVEAEIANAALYERLLASTERPHILRVYRALQAASQQRHLPAFRRCVERPRGRGKA
ncbi:MAG: DUF2202 domain-containing protein [Alphaproteobacteria bacterium]